MGNIVPIQKQPTLTQQSYDQIRAILVSGKLDEGTCYSAKHFASLLNVSRTPAREALLRLESEGYLQSRLGQGFVIRNYSKKDIVDYFETRKIIEIYVIEQLAKSITEEDLLALESLANTMRQKAHSDPEAFIEADRMFHTVLVTSYGNHMLLQTMENVRSLLSVFGLKSVSVSGRTDTVVSEHESILVALIDKNKSAATKAMAKHLKSTEDHLLAMHK